MLNLNKELLTIFYASKLTIYEFCKVSNTNTAILYKCMSDNTFEPKLSTFQKLTRPHGYKLKLTLIYENNR